MNQISKNRYLILGLTLLIPTLIIIHLFSGKIEVSLSDYFSSLFSYDESVSEQIIARNIRIPRMIMAVIAGAGLALSGLLMQTLFTNPLAGPYVLGINSGASLFVALFVMTGVQFFASDIGIIANALIGSFVFGLVILSFSKFVKNQIMNIKLFELFVKSSFSFGIFKLFKLFKLFIKLLSNKFSPFV